MESHATIVVNCLMMAMKSPQFKTLMANDSQSEYTEIKRFEFNGTEHQPKTTISIRYEKYFNVCQLVHTAQFNNIVTFSKNRTFTVSVSLNYFICFSI